MAELIAAGAALGTVSSIITFIDVAWRVSKRVKEYIDASKEVPLVLKHIKAKLPILIAKVAELKTASKDGVLLDPHSPLVEALQSCQQQITDLEQRISKLIPEDGESSLRRAKKAVLSIHYEKEVTTSWGQLESYQVTFMFYFTNTVDELKQLRASLQIKPIFSVPFKRDSNFVKRDSILKEINQALTKNGQAALYGIGGVGYVSRIFSITIMLIRTQKVTNCNRVLLSVQRKQPGCKRILGSCKHNGKICSSIY
jgi:hypothetical protein